LIEELGVLTEELAEKSDKVQDLNRRIIELSVKNTELDKAKSDASTLAEKRKEIILAFALEFKILSKKLQDDYTLA